MTFDQSIRYDDSTALLPLTSDLVFKAVYGRDIPECKQALIAVLNLLLERHGKERIRNLIYKNPFVISDSVNVKSIILDIKALLDTGEWVDIEMQMEGLVVFVNRSVLYGAKLLAEHLAVGENYDKMKKTIVISIVNGTLFPQITRPLTTFHLAEDGSHIRLTDILELRFLELGKIKADKKPNDMTPLERFGAYLKYAAAPEERAYVSELRAHGEEAIVMSDRLLRHVSEDEQMHELKRARELYELDQRSRISWARSEGEKTGELKGEKRGEKKGEARVNQLNLALIADKRYDDIERAAKDKKWRSQLMKEYGIS